MGWAFQRHDGGLLGVPRMTERQQGLGAVLQGQAQQGDGRVRAFLKQRTGNGAQLLRSESASPVTRAISARL